VIKSKNLIIRLSEDLHYKLKLKSVKEKKSIQQIVEDFIKNYVEDSDEEENKKK